MKLIPLKQWICDECGEIIERPEDGYIQFGYDVHGLCYDIIIVHHLSTSPRRDHNKKGCYRYNTGLSLDRVLGTEGLIRLLSKIDVGRHIDPDFSNQRIRSDSLRAWVEIVRRLHIPYYEEARLYWNKAELDGFFNGANEYWPYLPDTLKVLIEKYS